MLNDSPFDDTNCAASARMCMTSVQVRMHHWLANLSTRLSSAQRCHQFEEKFPILLYSIAPNIARTTLLVQMVMTSV